jgi:hypothetical protein
LRRWQGGKLLLDLIFKKKILRGNQAHYFFFNFSKPVNLPLKILRGNQAHYFF